MLPSLYLKLKLILSVFLVKPSHSRILLSNETEHVKVVDAMSYVPSPNEKCLESGYLVSPAISMGSPHDHMSPRHDEVFESPTAATDKYREFAPPRRRVRRR